jgi:hypothetical protein
MSRVLYRAAAVVGSIFVAAALAACASDASPQSAEPAAGETVVYHSDYPGYDTLPALYKKADLVVEARVAGPGQVRELQASDGGSDPKANPNAGVDAPQQAREPVVVTVFQAKISHVFKGSAKVGGSVEVKQLGGQVKGITYQEEGAVALQGGTTYLLFLAVFPDAPASLLNTDQAQYAVDSSGTLRRFGTNQLAFTRADVSKLATGK